MRPGPATQTAFVRGFLFCFVTARWRNDRFSLTALRTECRVPPLPKPIADPSSCDYESATAAAASGPLSCPLLPAPKSKEQRADGGGGRNARATSRARARFLDCPPAIHPRESPTAAGSTAIIRQAQETSRFAEPTLSQIVAPRNTKNSCPCAETVDDETSLWKPEEN
jgi:hypothetical protein